MAPSIGSTPSQNRGLPAPSKPGSTTSSGDPSFQGQDPAPANGQRTGHDPADTFEAPRPSAPRGVGPTPF